jgi:hypothetical protein
MNSLLYEWYALIKYHTTYPGADPGFQVRGGALKKLRRAEGGAKFFWVFRVKNHDFTPKNHIFSNFRRGVYIWSLLIKVITSVSLFTAD